ncbi:hypothetical protein T10_11427 [Trichinella papuae]|uniref:Uncharacterized protein n=1 Tax=Trichinella papuae TaxID=268474 RepID=A0A0V1MEP4_9BILA|nr:hypothetical protein T10_11427 [Trichinella papuae]
MIPSHANAFHLPVRLDHSWKYCINVKRFFVAYCIVRFDDKRTARSIRCYNTIFIDLKEATQVIETTDHLLKCSDDLNLLYLLQQRDTNGFSIFVSAP